VLTGGRLTLEDAYAYAKFARIVLETNDIDFRARAHSAEEAEFLAGEAGAGLGVTYTDLEAAPAVLLVGLEPEEEAPTVFLRLRKAVRRGTTAVHALAPFASRGLEKLSGSLVAVAPGTETGVLTAVADDDGRVGDLAAGLREAGAVILVGERLATVPGALSAVSRVAESTGARLAWIPRRAGERGALDAGALPTLLPGGRPISSAEARVDVAAAWGVEHVPWRPGRDTSGILAALADGELAGALVAGVEIADLPDPPAALAALSAARFVVSLEVRASEVSALADVVLPVAPVVEKAGTFVNWEGRERPFSAVLADTGAIPDVRVLSALADEFDVALGLPTVEAARSEFAELGRWDGPRAAVPATAGVEPANPGPGEAVLATWRLLLDAGRLQDGEPYLAATARRPVARMSATTAQEAGVTDGALLMVGTPHGSIVLPLEVTEMPDRVVWVPQNSPGCRVHFDLGTGAGTVVTVAAAPPDAVHPDRRSGGVG
jgi:NADH-quinone oxidoreductase subunit G